MWALHQPEGRALTGAVSLAGCLDLQQADADNLGGGAVRMLLGGPAHDHPDADPARLAPAPKPVVLIHGDRDVDVPIGISHGYRDRVAALDAPRTRTHQADRRRPLAAHHPYGRNLRHRGRCDPAAGYSPVGSKP